MGNKLRSCLYLLESCSIVSRDGVVVKMQELKGQIKDKDLEQLAAAKALGLKYLIAYDRDFENFSEYITPKKFIEWMKCSPSQTEY